jgi:hypothetical protein
VRAGGAGGRAGWRVGGCGLAMSGRESVGGRAGGERE